MWSCDTTTYHMQLEGGMCSMQVEVAMPSKEAWRTGGLFVDPMLQVAL